jgi:N-carbamoyl-L-amino-acid hydrolase
MVAGVAAFTQITGRLVTGALDTTAPGEPLTTGSSATGPSTTERI